MEVRKLVAIYHSCCWEAAIQSMLAWKKRSKDGVLYFQGVGTVISGTTLKGHIKLGDTLLLGPDLMGQFTPILIKSIHRKRMPVKEVRGGQTASFSLKKVTTCNHHLFRNIFHTSQVPSCIPEYCPF